MKTNTFEVKLTSLLAFAISSEEMISVRGGEDDPIVKPTPPPVII